MHLPVIFLPNVPTIPWNDSLLGKKENCLIFYLNLFKCKHHKMQLTQFSRKSKESTDEFQWQSCFAKALESGKSSRQTYFALIILP